MYDTSPLNRFLKPLIIALSLLATQAPAGTICLPYPYANPGRPDAARLARIMNGLAPVLAEFVSLQAALDDRAPRICLSDELRDAHGYTDPEENRIVLDAALPLPMQRAVILHELRHLDQLATGACPSDDLSMRAAGLGVLAMEADASAITMLIAWYLRENGDASVWQAVEKWPTQADIATRFKNEMTLSGDISIATSAAFDQWFNSDWRRENYYLAACMDYLETQERNKQIPQYNPLAADFLNSLCQMPQGGTYVCSRTRVFAPD
ncbi:hypothetical protein PEL8287_02827 [Roseovarius litorisediminis]|uniref:DUF6782 domain-containing protein n=1 Tax=Roseovarius litorisediminis TaxID=1312363 RepID=A0A1Y5T301_9RHOB|nr:DUF6782 family putative metallopeptidase [Roseovarius litorisediminis]SLN53022.1 hypothetical protein PEL8287_02827 [Roseovarius litorisediminis]